MSCYSVSKMADGDVEGAWILTGDEAADEVMRREHCYVAAPSMNLGKALLDLLTDPRLAGEAA